MLNKIKAICNFEGIDINEIKEISFYEKTFILNNGKEFYVLTNEEAQTMYEEMEQALNEYYTEYVGDELEEMYDVWEAGKENIIEVEGKEYYIYRLN